MRRCTESEIPPTAVGGLIQILSTKNFPDASCNPTHGSGWILQIGLGKNLNNPPTAVGGIPRTPSKFCLDSI